MTHEEERTPPGTPAPMRRAGGGVASRDLRLFLIAGEHSGDALGGKLMEAMNRRLRGRVRYLGVGGTAMQRHGLTSQFDIEEVAVMGPLSILPRLPRIVRRVYGTTAAAIAAEPDCVVIIDSPEFTHRIAKRVRKRNPLIPIVNYVSPQVWAWRPGRARRMRWYIDETMALLPFEPDAYARLEGPACTYVGHPLIERASEMREADPGPLAVKLALQPDRPVLLVLPGSRASEVGRLMEPFGAAIARAGERVGPIQVLIPAVASVRELIEKQCAGWPSKPHLIDGDVDRFRAYKMASAALTASGTATLELALAQVPAVVAYKVDAVAAQLRFLLEVPSIVLANLVLGSNVYPEYIQEAATAENLANAVVPLLSDSVERRDQLAGLASIEVRMRVDGASPSDAAADVVLRHAMRRG
ncbi:MAG: lipid-A-disaccharide synthase [Hyphomicrobium sp.]